MDIIGIVVFKVVERGDLAIISQVVRKRIKSLKLRTRICYSVCISFVREKSRMSRILCE